MISDYIMPIRNQNSHKATFGKILNFAGSKNYIGAAYLSSVAPLKVGAGFIALATEKSVKKAVSTLLPEAIYLSFKDGIRHISEYNVVLIGCGLGKNEKLFKSVVKKIKDIPLVIDADGLNMLSSINVKLPNNTILTPHPLEAARLLNIPLNDVLNDVKQSAQCISYKYDCVVVLKTHRTVICDKENLFVNQCGNSALAKAGSGDVLAGIIAGLLAQKTDCFYAAKLGVFLHARAAEIASKELTEYSLLASELPHYIPKAIAEIL